MVLKRKSKKVKKIKLIKPKPVSKKVLAKQQGFRSGLELSVHEQLTNNGIPYQYETEKISYVVPAHSSKYTPDFIFTKKDGSKLYIETKGYWPASERKKMQFIKQSNPELDIRLLFQNANNKITKSSKTTYGTYATKIGVLWADFKNGTPYDWFLD